MWVIEDDVHYDATKVYSCSCYFDPTVYAKRKSYVCIVNIKYLIKKKVNDNILLITNRPTKVCLLVLLIHHINPFMENCYGKLPHETMQRLLCTIMCE